MQKISIELTDVQYAALNRAATPAENKAPLPMDVWIDIIRSAAEQSTKDNPLTAESLAANLLSRACDSYASRQADADKAAMAANPRFMALATAVAAQPDKFDAVEAAVLPILQA